MCLPEIYAFLCDVLGVISLTILVKILGFLAVNICIYKYNVQKIWSPSHRIMIVTEGPLRGATRANFFRARVGPPSS